MDEFPEIEIEDGMPIVALSVALPEDEDDAPRASRRAMASASTHFGGADLGDLSDYQAEAAAAYGRFGYRFSRQFFVRNSVDTKNRLAAVIGGFVSSKPGLAAQVLRWDDAYTGSSRDPDVTEMTRFEQVYQWAADFVEHAARSGWTIRIEEED